MDSQIKTGISMIKTTLASSFELEKLKSKGDEAVFDFEVFLIFCLFFLFSGFILIDKKNNTFYINKILFFLDFLRLNKRSIC
jgi:hypothetical protein